jgi:uncharacterized protein (TIGR02246 family)
MSATLVLAFCLITISAAAEQRAPDSAREESEVREVVKRYVDARERGDAAAIGALFTEDADQLTSSGEWRKGREALVRGTLASSKANAGTRTIAIETVRFAAPGLAIADGKYTIAGAESGARNMWTSFVFVKTGGAWRIAAIRNMLPAPAAPAAKSEKS